MEAPDRLRTRDAVAASLSAMSSCAIYRLLNDGGRQEVSIGGATRRIEVAGSPVFVKMIKLSDRESCRHTGSVVRRRSAGLSRGKVLVDVAGDFLGEVKKGLREVPQQNLSRVIE